MKIICKPSRRKLREGVGQDVDVLVRLRAPAPAADREAARPPLAIVPIVDVSGSMAGRKLPSVKEALARLAEHLVPGDHLGLVTFDSEVATPFPLTEVTEAKKAEFLRAVQRLRPGSNTNLGGGLLEGWRLVESAALPPAIRARLILLTDGLANEGPIVSRDGLVKKTIELRTAPAPHGGVRQSLSAFGYGDDCDQALLGDLAQAGAGSYAYIENHDVVLTAFARELGGLLATHARELTVRVVPAAGAPVDKALGDLLFHGESAFVARVAAIARTRGADVELCAVEVRYRDETGAWRSERAACRVDYVNAGEEDRADAEDVVRLRDERILREAQETAEALARLHNFAGARLAIHDAMGRIADTALLAFAREALLPCYGDASEFHTRSSLRASSLAMLRGTRVVAAAWPVAQTFDVKPSAAEEQMETSFRNVPPKKPGEQ